MRFCSSERLSLKDHKGKWDLTVQEQGGGGAWTVTRRRRQPPGILAKLP